MDRDRRVELLAMADADALVDLADRCLREIPGIVVTRPPEVGVMVLQVREPVESIRVQLADVLVSRAEAALGADRGWAMRLGDCATEALAAAICDTVAAAATSSGDCSTTMLADEVGRLCTATADQIARASAAEWAELAETVVRFEEMDA